MTILDKHSPKSPRWTWTVCLWAYLVWLCRANLLRTYHVTQRPRVQTHDSCVCVCCVCV